MTTSAVVLRETSIDELESCGGELFVQNWSEVEQHLSSAPPDPLFSAYRQMEAAGMLVSIGAWDEDKLVGYVMVGVALHLNYQVLAGHHDLLFVDKAHRQGSNLGMRLIRAAEKGAKERGAKWLFWHAKPDSALATILRALPVEETVYRRNL